MKILEKILMILMLIVIFMKLYLLSGGSSLASISMTVLSLIYFPFGFAFLGQIPLRKIFTKNMYKEMTLMNIISVNGTGLSLSFICVGILYKLNSWPYANEYIVFGLAGLVIILVVALFRKIKFKQEKYFFMYKRIAGLSILGMIFLISPNLPIERIRFGDHPDYIEALEKYLNDPQNPELYENEQIEYMKATLPKEEFELYLKYKSGRGQKK